MITPCPVLRSIVAALMVDTVSSARPVAGMTITPCDKEDLDMPNHLSGK